MHPQSPPPPPLPQYNFYGGSSSSFSSNSLADHLPNQDFPRSLSQLLLSGLADEHERLVGSPFDNKKLEDWKGHSLNQYSFRVSFSDEKEEVAQSTTCNLLYGAAVDTDDELQASTRPFVQASSPTSCLTSLSSNLLNFDGSKAQRRNQNPPNSSECNSSTTGGASKKPRIQQYSSTQPVLKVRKEKLGDRITALHQLVSPFGKTDTASVLSEAIAYIRFLQSQIEALSSPYLGNVSEGSMGKGHQQLYVTDVHDRPKDLKTRGLCLVPVSCTQLIGSDNGADYWAPALGGGF